MLRRTFPTLLIFALGACASQAQTPAPAPVQPPAAATLTYKVDGVTFPSRAAAIAADRQRIAAMVDGLAAQSDPLKGRVRIVIPDHDRLRPLVAQRVKGATGEALEFQIDHLQVELRAAADGIVKARTFERATIVEQNDTIEPAVGDADYVVWYQVRSTSANNAGPWTGAWLVRRAGSDTRIPAGVDPGVAPGTPRFASFVKSVREAATGLGGLSVAAAGPGAAPSRNAAERRTVSSGSGIVVDAEGAVLTNNHVVEGCAELRVVDGQYATSVATLAARDRANDLALLKSPMRAARPARFRDAQDLRPGDSVVVTGYPLGTMLSAEMAVTTGSLTRLTGPRDDSRLLQLSAPVQPGNSGGPVLDAGGNVIGVVNALMARLPGAGEGAPVPQNINFAIKAAIARNFLETNHVTYAAATTRGDMSAADVGEAARRFTVRIECRR